VVQTARRSLAVSFVAKIKKRHYVVEVRIRLLISLVVHAVQLKKKEFHRKVSLDHIYICFNVTISTECWCNFL
jgi:hypothetical protein